MFVLPFYVANTGVLYNRIRWGNDQFCELYKTLMNFSLVPFFCALVERLNKTEIKYQN